MFNDYIKSRTLIDTGFNKTTNMSNMSNMTNM